MYNNKTVMTQKLTDGRIERNRGNDVGWPLTALSLDDALLIEKVLEKGVSEVLGVASPAKAMPPTTWEGANSGAYTALSRTSLGAE